MKSIFSTFKINDVKTGKPIDLIGTMQICLIRRLWKIKRFGNRPTLIVGSISVLLNWV